ncbi:ATP-binding protein [Gilvibacter sp.]|uniref:ATP-binding protein n=1 Tax=Gilvibacter sp. TaxID=2729997 RepID=UPI0025C178C6|nr:ATP-binding protein [Gilvibacter sp.]NQX77444.1 ATP-binding protein [Gilvibacter sp.]
MENKEHRIVITGAPGTGKTAVIDALMQKGYQVFPEVIREFTAEETATQDSPQIATNPIVFAKDSDGFNRRLLLGRQQQFFAGAALEKYPVFYDRGLPDVLAYMDYFNQEYGAEFEAYCTDHKYDQVFIMPPWEAIFHADGGRFETFEQAVDLHESLDLRYKYFGYELLEVPRLSIDERVHFILNELNHE